MIYPTEKDIGRKVIYQVWHHRIEEGVVTSFNDKFVFVRYGADTGSKATPRAALEWANPIPVRPKVRTGRWNKVALRPQVK